MLEEIQVPPRPLRIIGVFCRSKRVKKKEECRALYLQLFTAALKASWTCLLFLPPIPLPGAGYDLPFRAAPMQDANRPGDFVNRIGLGTYTRSLPLPL